MKCTTKCPMEKLKAMGRPCQFKDMKDEDNSCIKADIDAFVAAETKLQAAIKFKDKLEKEEKEEKENPKPYHDESEVLADELIVKRNNGTEPDISNMGDGQIGTKSQGGNKW